MYSSKRRKSGKGKNERKTSVLKRKRTGKNKKTYPEVTGKVQMTREGFIYVIIEGEEDDVFVRAGKTKGSLNGDIVRVSVTKEKTELRHREGEIIEIVERSRKPFVGILHIVGQQAWVLMQSRFMPYDISVELPEDGTAQSGMKVAVIVDHWERHEPNPHGIITDILGKPGENDTEMHAILAEYALPYRFEPEVENAADSISEEITKKDLKERSDFRDTLTFTIDPADAKDFDDALSFKKLPDGNYQIGVHIADVSHYVRPGDIIDKEAQARGTSVYLVDRTVPMLPEKLSNKLCSLRPNEDKLAFSAIFEITPQGKIMQSRFCKTVINSDYRFAYETAQQVIDNGQKSLEMELRGGTDGRQKASDSAMGKGAYEGCIIPRELKEAILILWNIASVLRKKRFNSGAINFERPEMKVEVDEKGRPVKVYQKITKEANWLVEEFMLLANRSVAEFIATSGKGGKADKNAKTFIYRVHDEPNSEKIHGLSEFAGNFGYKMGAIGTGKEIAKSLNELLSNAKDTPELAAIEILALRSMAKACYSTDNIGHYGLAFKYYTHFTSPIRRYPDTMVHRLLAMYLNNVSSQSKEYYSEQCKYASEREVIAANAERDSIKYKLVEYMQDKIGGEFEGHISGLTDWGMYVEIEPTKIEGMIALRDIRTDFFEFDAEHYKITGKRTGKTYRLGDAVKIKVKSANLEQKLLDYELVSVDKSEEQNPQEKKEHKNFRREKIKAAIKTSKTKSLKKSKNKKS
ncbi:MAG: ribonuclease R family protein [Candidatus Cryptobacteroides sp.]